MIDKQVNTAPFIIDVVIDLIVDAGAESVQMRGALIGLLTGRMILGESLSDTEWVTRVLLREAMPRTPT